MDTLRKCVNDTYVELSPEEAQAVRAEWARNDPATVENKRRIRNFEIKQKIIDLERNQGRALREAALGLGTTSLESINEKISALRSDME